MAEQQPTTYGASALFNFLSREPIHDPLASPTPTADTEVKTTTCYMCACRCGIRVHLRDGEVRYIDGNPEPSAEPGRDLRQGRVRAS